MYFANPEQWFWTRVVTCSHLPPHKKHSDFCYCVFYYATSLVFQRTPQTDRSVRVRADFLQSALCRAKRLSIVLWEVAFAKWCKSRRQNTQTRLTQKIQDNPTTRPIYIKKPRLRSFLFNLLGFTRPTNLNWKFYCETFRAWSKSKTG